MTVDPPPCGVILGTSRRPCVLASGHRGDFHRDGGGNTAAVHDATERERRANGQHLQRLREFRVGLPPGQRPVTILLDEFDALLAVAAERDALAREACTMPDERAPWPPPPRTDPDAFETVTESIRRDARMVDESDSRSENLRTAIANLRTGLLKRLTSTKVRRMFPAGTTADLRFLIEVAERSIDS